MRRNVGIARLAIASVLLASAAAHSSESAPRIVGVAFNDLLNFRGADYSGRLRLSHGQEITGDLANLLSSAAPGSTARFQDQNGSDYLRVGDTVPNARGCRSLLITSYDQFDRRQSDNYWFACQEGPRWRARSPLITQETAPPARPSSQGSPTPPPLPARQASSAPPPPPARQASSAPLPPPARGEITFGSGTIVSLSGEVVTNDHVVAPCNTLAVMNAEGTEYPARFIAKAPGERDLALIQMDGPVMAHVSFPLRGEFPQPSDSVLIAGYPYVQGRYVNFELTEGVLEPPVRGTSFGLAFQGSVTMGNSGGPVLDRWGRMVGLVAGRVVAAKDTGVGLTADEVTAFLDARQVNYQRNSLVRPLGREQIASIARRATVGIKCTH